MIIIVISIIINTLPIAGWATVDCRQSKLRWVSLRLTSSRHHHHNHRKYEYCTIKSNYILSMQNRNISVQDFLPPQFSPVKSTLVKKIFSTMTTLSTSLSLIWLQRLDLRHKIQKKCKIAMVTNPFGLFWNKFIWKHPLSTAKFCLFVCLSLWYGHTDQSCNTKEMQIALMRNPYGPFWNKSSWK